MSRRYASQIERRRRVHRTLIWIIFATLPFYFCGIILLVVFSGGDEEQLPLTNTPALGFTPTNTVEGATAVNTVPPSLTLLPGGPTITLPATPTQFTISTRTPTSTVTPTNFPTATPTDTPTARITPDAAGTQAAQN